ncbi:hypothetical protein HNQ91_004644 [Filimonas zeae]|uniref:Uncharacterized protein n=1 Tax=Filimonas zeae TaxID=1737353 RepID=A0A917J2N3_9BACT|nr:DUF6686 family protein [Filimonas zeae]MDR6341571.1 hypothetical protein [Filimonas zeae]GGH75217.1 hypothetical protein GCM10011379_38560 [Filimonas zeae]
MCNFKQWSHNKHGYIIQCDDCKSFQLCFGTTMLTLREEEYVQFSEWVVYKRESLVPLHDKNLKSISLPTVCPQVQVIVTEKELNNLYELVQEADNEMKVNQLLSLFHG